MNDQPANTPTRRRIRGTDVLIVGIPVAAAAILLLPLLGILNISSEFFSPTVAGILLDNLWPTLGAAALITVAIVNARRDRVGLIIGSLAALAGFGLAVLLVQVGMDYASRGGLSSIGAGFAYVVAGVTAAAALGLLWGLRNVRGSFSTSWRRADGVAIAVVVAIAAMALPLRGVLSAAVEREQLASDASLEEVQDIVAGMDLEIRLVEASVAPVAGAAEPGLGIVERLVVDVELASVQALGLATSPTLCLTHSRVTQYAGTGAADLCWGVPRPEAAVPNAWGPELAVPATTTTMRLTLVREGSKCSFPPGLWTAALTLTPNSAEAPGMFRVNATFSVPSEGLGQTSQPAAVPPGDDCID